MKRLWSMAKLPVTLAPSATSRTTVEPMVTYPLAAIFTPLEIEALGPV